MRILVACEESQAVMKAFRNKGHDAWSCDLEESSGGMPQYHLHCDVTSVLNEDWDMIIAFPPCTHLASSGARWFKEKIKDGRQKQAIDFFMLFANHNCKKIAIENPVGIMSTIWRKPDQIIHPWQFGHAEQKTTCLWLKGLPLLKETKTVYDEMMQLSKNQRERLHYLPPGTERAKIRSKTFQGVAEAMTTQWVKQ